MNDLVHIALLTGGSDKHYALGLASALAAKGTKIDFVGSDELNCPEICQLEGLRFLNLRGDQREDAPAPAKALRVLRYYARLAAYAARARTPVLHILWNNRFVVFDQTILMLYYRALGKRVVLTAHNVNIGKRDRRESRLRRLALQTQYRLCHHVFVHTEPMKAELLQDFGLCESVVTVIPYGINDAVPRTALTRAEARQRLGIESSEKTLLCFGQIAPYKGLERVVSAIHVLAKTDGSIRLLIAGKVKRGAEDYWRRVDTTIEQLHLSGHVRRDIRFIPDDEIEVYFKATDAVVLPYVDIYQSGVLFLALSFGTPVIGTDVGSLRDDVIDGATGVLCSSPEPSDLAAGISAFFSGEMYQCRESRSDGIRRFVSDRHSWERVADFSRTVYARLSNGAV